MTVWNFAGIIFFAGAFFGILAGWWFNNACRGPEYPTPLELELWL